MKIISIAYFDLDPLKNALLVIKNCSYFFHTRISFYFLTISYRKCSSISILFLFILQLLDVFLLILFRIYLISLEHTYHTYIQTYN